MDKFLRIFGIAILSGIMIVLIAGIFWIKSILSENELLKEKLKQSERENAAKADKIETKTFQQKIILSSDNDSEIARHNFLRFVITTDNN